MLPNLFLKYQHHPQNTFKQRNFMLNKPEKLKLCPPQTPQMVFYFYSTCYILEVQYQAC